jgi:hypothetical protein
MTFVSVATERFQILVDRRGVAVTLRIAGLANKQKSPWRRKTTDCEFAVGG